MIVLNFYHIQIKLKGWNDSGMMYGAIPTHIFSYRLVIKCHPSRTQRTREDPRIIIIQSCKLNP